MERQPSIFELMLAPIAITTTYSVLLVVLLVEHRVPAEAGILLAVVWIIMLTARAVLRARRLRSVLAAPQRPMRQLRLADFGVTDGALSSGEPDTYVPREFEQEVADALTGRKLVVLYGERRAGKSRTAFEILRRPRFENW